jgi:hypothetical protein
MPPQAGTFRTAWRKRIPGTASMLEAATTQKTAWLRPVEVPGFGYKVISSGPS